MTDLWDAVRAHAAAGRVAIEGAHDLTYADLAERVEDAASGLRRHAGPGDVIALDVDLPETGLVGILAAQAVGAAFLPLDHQAPSARRSSVLADSGATAVLTESSPFELDVAPLGRPADVPVLSDPCYVMYTSGSTGRPKGVVVPRQSLVERLASLQVTPGFDSTRSFLALTALTFDIALAELLLPVVTGGRIVTVDRSARYNVDVFASAIERSGVDVVQATPSVWRFMVSRGWSGRADLTLWSGGEALTPTLAQQLLDRCGALWNVYGPTEATIWSTANLVQPGEPISLGQPLPGTSLHLRDTDGSVITGSGSVGEIVISGSGLAAGYLSATATDVARFSPTTSAGPASYRTGDRGRYRADGSLEFLGRNDTQIKLRGHRIELGEIEAALEEHPDVVEAAAGAIGLDEPDGGSIAAVVAIGSSALTARELRGWLAARLPTPMLPRRLELVPALPKTTTGKVDRRGAFAALV